MTDPTVAALAAALRETSSIPVLYRGDVTAWAGTAAAVLAALPPGWCGHDAAAIHQDGFERGMDTADDANGVEIARLRGVERLAMTNAAGLLAAGKEIERLRAALDEVERTTRELDTQGIARAALAPQAGDDH